MNFKHLERIDFGKVYIHQNQTDFYQLLNKHIVDIYKCLPVCMHTDATLFMYNYAHINLGEPIDIFRKFYPPSWTILYWLITVHCPETNDLQKAYLVKAHAMAMYLHSIDDHLNDHEIPTTPFTILVRSELWRVMIDAMRHYADDILKGNEIITTHVNTYYRSNYYSSAPNTIDEYCQIFTEQMATWSIMPILLARKAGFTEQNIIEIKTAFESFGVAWRLLDDIIDLKQDFANKTHSSIYISLPEIHRHNWDNHNGDISIIAQYLDENHSINNLVARIIQLLQDAALLVRKNKLEELAVEFLTLAKPLEELST